MSTKVREYGGLALKLNVPLLVLGNITIERGARLLTGTRLTTIRLERNAIWAEIVGGTRAGEEVCISAACVSRSWESILQLAFAINVHKAQSLTVKGMLGVYLPPSGQCYAHGMLYSALGHAVSPRQVKVYKSGKAGEQERIFANKVIEEVMLME